MESGTAVWKTVWQFHNIVLLYNPAIVLLGIYPNELKIYIHTNFYMNIYRSFNYNFQIWKQLRCPSIGERIKQNKTKL